MKPKFEGKDLTEGALMAALTMVLILGSEYIPLFSVVGTFGACVPIACLAMRRRPATAILAVAACAVLSVFVTHSIAASIELSLLLILPGLAAGIGFRRRSGFFSVLASVCACTAAGVLFSVFVLNFLTGGKGIQGLFDETAQMFETAMNGALSGAYQGMPGISQDTFGNMISDLTKQMKEMMMLYFPSMLLIMVLVVGYVQTMLCAFFIRRTRSGSPVIVPFNQMQATKPMCYITMVLLFLSLFLSGKSMADAALLNACTILSFLIGICGFSVIDALLARKIRRGIFRAMIYAGVAIVGGMLLGLILNGLMILGVLDCFMDFRKIRKVRETHEE